MLGVRVLALVTGQALAELEEAAAEGGLGAGAVGERLLLALLLGFSFVEQLVQLFNAVFLLEREHFPFAV